MKKIVLICSVIAITVSLIKAGGDEKSPGFVASVNKVVAAATPVYQQATKIKDNLSGIIGEAKKLNGPLGSFKSSPNNKDNVAMVLLGLKNLLAAVLPVVLGSVDETGSYKPALIPAALNAIVTLPQIAGDAFPTIKSNANYMKVTGFLNPTKAADVNKKLGTLTKDAQEALTFLNSLAFMISPGAAVKSLPEEEKLPEVKLEAVSKPEISEEF